MNRIMNRHGSIAVLLCAAVLSACDAFDKNKVQDIAGPVPAGARIKFFNFGDNAPGVNFYADDRKMTAISSATAPSMAWLTVAMIPNCISFLMISPALIPMAPASSDTETL